jgi:hypothetical protein
VSRPGVRKTLRALCTPRRLVPIALVAVSLLIAQAAYSDEPLALPLALSMCLAFLAVAPVSYRVLFEDEARWPRRLVLAALYGSIGVGVVSGLGLMLPRWLGMNRTLLTTPSNLVVCVALFLVGGWGLGRDIGLEDRLRREADRADRMARRVEDAQLLALRSHLDPHFLFNTLNAIAEWCVLDGAVAERAVLELSRMLRTILVGVRREAWSLAEELALCDTLCALHRLRDPALEVRRVADDALPSIELPPLLLLPLVENAIKHGPSAGHRGEICLEVRRVEDRVSISLSNPGPYRGPRAGSDGIPTLERRLALAYPERASFRIAGAGARTIAELDLPLHPGDRQ